jgi:hypothetical protein
MSLVEFYVKPSNGRQNTPKYLHHVPFAFVQAYYFMDIQDAAKHFWPLL